VSGGRYFPLAFDQLSSIDEIKYEFIHCPNTIHLSKIFSVIDLPVEYSPVKLAIDIPDPEM
jgi:hypothetical protein